MLKLIRKFQLVTGSLQAKILFVFLGLPVKKIKSNGTPFIRISKKGKIIIDDTLFLNNTHVSNPIGRTTRCSFVINDDAVLRLGANVGMSGVSIVCDYSIDIRKNVKIGGNTVIYDTDFHSLKAKDRLDTEKDSLYASRKKITIEENAFIGAHCTILKGVRIGKNSVVGACSLVTKDIPDNQVWGGNPVKFIRKL